MLYEIPQLRQSNRIQVKRWFTSRDMDLFIWLHKNVPVRFQLAYNKRDTEKAINWDLQKGLRHYLVDSGETDLEHYKQTPILIDMRDQIDIASIARNFLVACEKIDTGLSDFIYARLMEHPPVPAPRNAKHKGHFVSK